MMLFDFCDGRTLPIVTCDKVCTDSNPVENLVSVDYKNKLAGFIGENFVRPPVNVTIQFPCNIEIHHVIIYPVVGAQKSVGFEIYTCSDKVDVSPLLQRKKSKIFCKSSFFVPIGKILLPEADTVCFSNHLFKNNEPPKQFSEPYNHNAYLRHTRTGALNFVSHLTVRITRTVGGSAVCIKRLEVWGRPSKSLQKEVNDVLKELISPKLQANTSDGFVKDDGTNTESKEYQDNGITIPEEFIDSITYDIMAVPILLPCGKNIDQSTLDKHISSEASWGRMPSDPYTGLVFDSQRKPVPNVSLKGRIDQFILNHSDELKNVPRTSGRHNKSGPALSCIVNQSIKLTPGPSIDSTINQSGLPETFRSSLEKHCTQQTESCKRETLGSRKMSNKRPISESNSTIPNSIIDLTGDFNSKQVSKVRKLDTNFHSASTVPECIDLTGDTPTSNNQSVPKSHTHDKNLKNTLNTALETMLCTLPSFTKQQKPQITESQCCFCRTSVISCLFYTLTCSHLICRSCLDTCKENEIDCKLCHIKSSKNNVSRAHVS